MINFCKYKNALGKPNTGIHAFRFKNIAVIDVLLTIILAIVIKNYYPKQHFLLILAGCFLAGVILHRIFCVKTTIDKLLFGK
tara:strand:- start:236 stop:481 length:246 start_codon:yes stop_codon:yes gene_type:complete